MILYNADAATVRELEARKFMVYGPGTRDRDGGYFYQDNLRSTLLSSAFFTFGSCYVR